MGPAARTLPLPLSPLLLLPARASARPHRPPTAAPAQHLNCSNSVLAHLPYMISLDHGKRAIVLSIRRALHARYRGGS